jgi:EAL domain-containing protein (putative c-di-GMP-specific phosphodiesterase class I)
LRTGQVTGLEALARWEHPQRGYIPPAEFIPLAEETGLVAQIGAWVLEEACRQASDWQVKREGAPPFVISVNLSARQFQEPGLVEQVARVLAMSGVRPELLRLEITESVVVQEAGSARETLQALKALGVQIAIDDFGIGYSSLAYLTRLFADTVKIDRSFVAAVDQDERAQPIIGAIASLAHALGMDVTAEGIEDAAQLAHVREAGCDRAQGYFFSHPIPADKAADLLRRTFETDARVAIATSGATCAG